jgi:multiple sugar transport system substrate-binding protein
MSGKKVHRREFLKVAGLAGLGLMAGQVVAGCAQPAPQVVEKQVEKVVTKEVEVQVTAAPTAWKVEVPSQPLEFYGWDFQPQQIEKNIQIFTEQTQIPVNVNIIPNVGFSGALQTKIMGGIQMDVFYNFRYNTSKFYYAGWARRLDDLPGADQVLADMFPNAVPLFTAQDGALICLPYFNAVHMLYFNKSYVEQAGFSGPPKTRQEVYDQCKKIKEAGLASIPYAAYWVKEFCEEYLMVYLLADGIKPFDEKYDPVWKDHSEADDMFDWWQAMYQDELTSPTMLTDQVTQVVTTMQEGQAAFFTLHHYFLKGIREAGAKESANVYLSDYMPGKTGQTFLMGEVIQMSARPTSLSAAWELMKFYGWKDQDGQMRTFKEWAKAAALACPYPSFFEDKEVQEAYGSFYDFKMLVDVFQNRSDPVQARNATWYPEFQTFVGDTIHELLQGKKTGKEASAALADKVVALKKEIAG